MRTADIEKFTEDLLRRHDLFKASIDIKKIVKKESIPLIPYELGDEISGMLVLENGQARIGYNQDHHKVRQRFTIAHELGHYFLHSKSDEDKLFLSHAQVMFRKNTSKEVSFKKEKEANMFAASILMPKFLIEEAYDKILNENSKIDDDQIVWHLSTQFVVSQLAMSYRLKNLNKIYF